MISKRIVTAAVCIPFVVYIIGFGGQAFFLAFMSAVLLIGLWEFFTMTLPGVSRTTFGIGLVLGSLILASAFHDSGMDVPARQSLLPGACALSFAALFWYHMSKHSVELHDASRLAMAQFCGMMYIPFLGSYLILLRGRPDGIALIFLILLVTWVGDTSAFAIGSLMGKRRLSTRISPKKTIEGALASLAGGVLTTIIFKLLYLQSLSLAHCLVIGIGLNIMNQFGDLCESFIKRACNVKDSGTLFPGHGGVLDRIDSLLFAGPFLFYYINRVLPV